MVRFDQVFPKHASPGLMRASTALPVAARLLRSGAVLALAILLSGIAAPDEGPRDIGPAIDAMRLLVTGLVVLELASLLWRSLGIRAVPVRQRPAPAMTNATGRGDFIGVLERCFAEWALTSSEQAVALLAIKGFSNTEIASLRATAEATVKCQLNAVYRKAGVTGRSQLISTVLDEVLVILPQGTGKAA